MKVLQINTVCGTGSTGKIAVDLYKTLAEENHDCLIGYGRGNAPPDIQSYRIGSDFDMYYHALMSRITDKSGFYSIKSTKKFIKKIEYYNPDIIHLHIIHGYYLNVEVLFKYLKEINKPIIWTLHACWEFTGHCAYFDYVACDKWKTDCFQCPQKKEYPKSIIFDNSKWNYQKKKELFTSIKNMTIITPSEWLAGLVKQSFLRNYSVQIINNGIDLNIFKPTKSNFRERYNLKNKFVILGVANIWEKRKCLNDFIKLSKILDDNYKIVLIGVNKQQLQNLPANILGFMRTNSVMELAEIYTMADVFVNPTLEDNFPTVNLEALACGTPVITYNTGGSGEPVDDSCGIVVEKGSINALKESIETVRINRFEEDNCINRAKLYDKKDRFGEYIKTYQKILK